jgi:hypothetical protein
VRPDVVRHVGNVRHLKRPPVHTRPRIWPRGRVALWFNLRFTGLTQNLGQLYNKAFIGFSVKLLGQLANFGSTL